MGARAYCEFCANGLPDLSLADAVIGDQECPSCGSWSSLSEDTRRYALTAFEERLIALEQQTKAPLTV